MSRANLALSPDSLIFTVLWFGSLQSYVTLFDGIRDALQWLYLAVPEWFQTLESKSGLGLG